MTSESYLRSEARWAREQAAKARRVAADLADPKWLTRERTRRGQLLARARMAVAAAEDELAELADPGALIEREQADADRWEQLAREYETRICQVEDQPMWEEAK